jgi:hypothetical protein
MGLPVSSNTHRDPPNTELLSARLWDLRAQAEAKLRCLTRLQQTVGELKQSRTSRTEKIQHILKDLTDIVTISKSLHDVARLALQEAMQLS